VIPEQIVFSTFTFLPQILLASLLLMTVCTSQRFRRVKSFVAFSVEEQAWS
jgi:hypothetical protein